MADAVSNTGVGSSLDSSAADPTEGKPASDSIGTIRTMEDLKKINYLDENGNTRNAYDDMMLNMGIAAANECKKMEDRRKKAAKEFKVG